MIHKNKAQARCCPIESTAEQQQKNNTTDIINENFRLTGTWKSPQVIPVESQNKAQD